jgi:hypothetical protein
MEDYPENAKFPNKGAPCLGRNGCKEELTNQSELLAKVLRLLRGGSRASQRRMVYLTIATIIDQNLGWRSLDPISSMPYT